MSSPMMTRMLGFGCWAQSGAVGIIAAATSHSIPIQVLANVLMIDRLLELVHVIETRLKVWPELSAQPLARALAGRPRIAAAWLRHPSNFHDATYCSARDPTASKAKRRFQSSFMLMTVQPLLFASS